MFVKYLFRQKQKKIFFIKAHFFNKKSSKSNNVNETWKIQRLSFAKIKSLRMKCFCERERFKNKQILSKGIVYVYTEDLADLKDEPWKHTNSLLLWYEARSDMKWWFGACEIHIVIKVNLDIINENLLTQHFWIMLKTPKTLFKQY